MEFKKSKTAIRYTKYAIQNTSAFTLIELLVVCGIMALIAGLMLANQTKFGGQVLLQNFAYDMALSIRQAQVYGISVQGYNASFKAGYGIHFDTNNTRYILYGDTDNSGAWNSTIDQQKAVLNITRSGYAINTKCVTVSGTETCGVKQLEIVFQRPEPDALISWQDSASTWHYYTAGARADSARIEVISPRSEKMSVRISQNGQIAVDQAVTN